MPAKCSTMVLIDYFDPTIISFLTSYAFCNLFIFVPVRFFIQVIMPTGIFNLWC